MTALATTDPRERVLALLRAHGWNATSFQVLEHGFAYWFDPVTDGCVAYVDTGRAWVAAGSPIAAVEELAACGERFASAAHAAGRRVCFFAVEDRFAERDGVASMPIGEQPSWDPSVWKDVVAGDRRLREQLRRARAKGVSTRAISASDVAAVDAPMRSQVEELVVRWQASRKMAPMGFIVDVQLFEFAEERRCFVAERDGRAIGLLVAVPVYQRAGWLFEDLLRLEAAPNGTTELLVDTAMRAVAAEGSRYVTLGLAPLAGGVHRGLRFFRALGAALYDFDGVRRFKAKLRPDAWTRIHLAWPEGQSGHAAILDALGAFTMRARDGHERASFVRFGLETIAHAPAFAVRVLAVLLVPWTIVLALAPTARFFPSRYVQLAWVFFDAAVLLAMVALGWKWRRGLARVLALATLLDAVLTLGEVLLDAAFRARTLFDADVLVVACIGPILATSLLWGALRRGPTPSGNPHTSAGPLPASGSGRW
ncbi:MAG: hypothetical protein JWP87_1960 [Labilithrix sp.]|nr:hypothetical protein [Labilithrix sp.]